MKATYHPKYGLRLTFYTPDFGFSWRVPDDWTIAQVERYVGELMGMYS